MYLKNHFLIASPALEDPRFSGRLAYICEHDAQGAMAIVINELAHMSLHEVLLQLNLAKPGTAMNAEAVFIGGPVCHDRGFVLHSHTPAWQSTLAVTDALSLTTSVDILQAIAHDDERKPQSFILALGYAGWDAGQLESELMTNAWLVAPAKLDILFDVPPSDRHRAALQSMGVDIDRWVGDIGHA